MLIIVLYPGSVTLRDKANKSHKVTVDTNTVTVGVNEFVNVFRAKHAVFFITCCIQFFYNE